MITAASLCTGYGGLDRAVEAVFGAELVWCSEIGAAACRVIDARFPNVPNLGDLRGIDVPPSVDILTGGFPCQPVSSAGRQRGVDDERWLFDDICGLLGRMGTRPRLCVFENVVGLLTANGGDAMARVVHGLAGLGYVGRVRVVRACDVGACHQRARVFIVARDAERAREDSRSAEGGSWGPVGEPDRVVAYGDGAGRGGVSGVPSGRVAVREPRVDVERCGDAVADTAGGRRDERRPGHGGGESGAQRVPLDSRGSSVTASDSDGSVGRSAMGAGEAVYEPGALEQSGRRDRVDFGPFIGAIERWERISGRCAPDPADGNRRLSPRFVEWMMGLSDGWVTDVLVKRTEALRCLGNGVVPQQAEYAIRGML